jgi:hypothetical protein
MLPKPRGQDQPLLKIKCPSNSCVLGKRKKANKRQDLETARGHSENLKRSVQSDVLPMGYCNLKVKCAI